MSKTVKEEIADYSRIIASKSKKSEATRYILEKFVSLELFDAVRDPTGFIYGQTINVSYDKATRKITLSKIEAETIKYLYRGEFKELSNPFISDAHNTGSGAFFLVSENGEDFTWSNTPFNFYDIQVAFVAVSGSDIFGIRETHGTMPFQSHQNAHNNIGTTLESGGKATAGTYAENTASNAANSPSFDSAIVADEDNETTIAAWVEGTYTTLRIGAGGAATFDTAATLPFRTAGSYLLVNDVLTGGEAAGINGRFYNVYQILMPTTSDTDSQKYRTLFLQPQKTFQTLEAAQAEDIRSLNFGTLNTLSPEFVTHARITYSTRASHLNTGKCVIATGGISYALTSRCGQINIAGYTPTSHSALTDLTWLTSGHVGSFNKRPLFNELGEATEKDDTLISLSDMPQEYPAYPERGFTFITKNHATQKAEFSSRLGHDSTGVWSQGLRQVDSGFNTLYSLPTAAPSANNQFLLSHLSGVSSWVTPTSLYLSDVAALTNGYLPYKTAGGLANSLNFYDGTNSTFVGGIAAGSRITYKSTTSTGTPTGIAYQWLGGTNGGTVIGTVLNNSNWGLGTTNPFSKLQIGVHGTFTGTLSNQLNIFGAYVLSRPTLVLNTTDVAAVGYGGAIGFGGGSGAAADPYQFAKIMGAKELAGASYNGYLAFFTTSSDSNVTDEKMRITSTGNVGIGTIDLDGTPPIGRLTVKGSTADGSTNIFVGRDSAEVNVYRLDTDGNATHSGYIQATTAKLTTGAVSGYYWSCTNVDGSGAWAAIPSQVYPAAGIPVSTGSGWGTSITDNSANWNTAYSQTRQWDGGSTGLVAATGRTSLGATTIGSSMFTLTNPSAITFPRFNADNTVSALSASGFRTAIGATNYWAQTTWGIDSGTANVGMGIVAAETMKLRIDTTLAYGAYVTNTNNLVAGLFRTGNYVSLIVDNNSASGYAAIQSTSTGSGAGVAGINSGSGPGVRGTSTTGYGGVFSGLGINISAGSLYIGGTSVIASTRIADFVSLKIGSTERISLAGVFTPSNGVSGTWTTVDGKTITANNGIITAIV